MIALELHEAKCDRCRQKFKTTGIPRNLIRSMVLTLCEKCEKELWKAVGGFIPSPELYGG